MIKRYAQVQDLGISPNRKILTVSEITSNIKQILEEKFSMIWISGETSNLRIPSSRHAYFTLKDEKSQISAVMFRGQLRQLKFNLEDGMNLIGLGRLSVYAPRGNYQIILEYAHPKGIGELQVAFTQLKAKLETEGLFLDEHKLAIPFLPKRIGIVTSPSGSVVRDILKVIKRRFNNLVIDIYPVRVQGTESANEIIKAIQFANHINRNDLLLIARGGGSLEDLAPFNGEDVARAIFNSKIPIVSAIGHETDYTIADFVADLRAPTPSSAAEIIVPLKADLKNRIAQIKHRYQTAMINKLNNNRLLKDSLDGRIVHPGKKVQDLKLHLDNLLDRLRLAFEGIIKDRKTRSDSALNTLKSRNPEGHVDLLRAKIEVIRLKLSKTVNGILADGVKRYKTTEAVLSAVNPTAILQRGYSITRLLPNRKVVMDSRILSIGQQLEIQLAKGKVDVSFIRTKVNRKNDED